MPHTFLRTKLFTHVFGGAAEAQKTLPRSIKHACERAAGRRAADGKPAHGSALVAQFHRQLDEAYAGSS